MEIVSIDVCDIHDRRIVSEELINSMLFTYQPIPFVVSSAAHSQPIGLREAKPHFYARISNSIWAELFEKDCRLRGLSRLIDQICLFPFSHIMCLNFKVLL